MTQKYDSLDIDLISEYLEERKMFLMDQNSIGEIEDICGQLGDIEGTEECIERLIKIIEPYKDMKFTHKVWNEDYGFWEEKEKEGMIAELERDAREGNL